MCVHACVCVGTHMCESCLFSKYPAPTSSAVIPSLYVLAHMSLSSEWSPDSLPSYDSLDTCHNSPEDSLSDPFNKCQHECVTLSFFASCNLRALPL